MSLYLGGRGSVSSCQQLEKMQTRFSLTASGGSTALPAPSFRPSEAGFEFLTSGIARQYISICLSHQVHLLKQPQEDEYVGISNVHLRAESYCHATVLGLLISHSVSGAWVNVVAQNSNSWFWSRQYFAIFPSSRHLGPEVLLQGMRGTC